MRLKDDWQAGRSGAQGMNHHTFQQLADVPKWSETTGNQSELQHCRRERVSDWYSTTDSSLQHPQTDVLFHRNADAPKEITSVGLVLRLSKK